MRNPSRRSGWRARARRRPWALWVIVLSTIFFAVAAAAYMGGPNVAVIVPDAAVVSVHPVTATQATASSRAAPVIVVTPVHPVEVYEPAGSSPGTPSRGLGTAEAHDSPSDGEGGSADEPGGSLPPLATAPTGTPTTTPTPVTTTAPPPGTTTTTTTTPSDDGNGSDDDGANRSGSGSRQVDR